MAKKGILGAILLAVLAGVIYANYPRSRAIISDQANVTSQKGVKVAMMRFEYCAHIIVTEVVDGYNVACINVYAGE